MLQPAFWRRWSSSMETAWVNTWNAWPITRFEASVGEGRALYGRQDSRRSRARRPRTRAAYFQQALTVLAALPESPSTLEEGFEIRLEEGWCSPCLGTSGGR